MDLIVTLFATITAFADRFADITQGFGAVGVLLFVLIYISIVLFFLPITPFSLVAGAVYGWWGVPVAFTGAVLGALSAFWIARGVGHDYVARICERRPIVRALERVMVKGGFRLVLLIRLSGLLPFAVQNYSFGLTAVNWRSYLYASMIGLVPGTVIKVWIGRTGMNALHGGLWVDWVNTVSLALAVAISLAMLIYVGVLAVRELRAEGVFDRNDENTDTLVR